MEKSLVIGLQCKFNFKYNDHLEAIGIYHFSILYGVIKDHRASFERLISFVPRN